MVLRRIVLALAAVLAIVAGTVAAVPASAATGAGSVAGHVMTSDGAPAVGVAIVLGTGHSDEPNHTYRVTTDASGDYDVSGVAPDAYAVVLPSDSPWVVDDHPSVSVPPGTAVTAPTLTVRRPAIVRGTAVSAIDGSPIAGLPVGSSSASLDGSGSSGGGAFTRTAADGSFALVGRPGTVRVYTGSSDWFSAQRTLTAGEGAEADTGTIALDPAGLVATGIYGRSGHPIENDWQSAVVDGCRVRNGYTATPCPAAVAYATVQSLQLAPGRHSIRYEVRNPVSSVVRHVSREVDVVQGRTTALGALVVRADPAQVAKVHASRYRRGHRVSVVVDAAAYVDGARPHLRTTFRVSGHAVAPVSVVWRKGVTGKTVLVATLPKRWSARRSLTVRAVVHGTHAYAGFTTRSQKLVRAR